MQLFFQPQISPGDKEAVLDKEESRHIIKVLRKKEGDILFLTNGKGWSFNAEIISAQPQKCVVKIISEERSAEKDYKIHLAVAPTKKNERFEWFLEKSTELGIDKITPVICKNSERKIVKPQRYEKVIQSAMKQSLHTFLPKLDPAVPFNDFIQQKFNGQKFIAHCEDSGSKKELFDLIKTSSEVTILIGPEGDFNSEEIEMAKNKGWQPVGLGDSRLRTETAAVIACHTIILANHIKNQ